MSRSGADGTKHADRTRGTAPKILAFLLTFLGVAGAATAQGVAQSTSGFELTRTTQRSLYRLQESWLQWVSAIYRDNPARAEEAVAAIDANGRLVGMTRLVDFSLGAVALALQASRDDHEQRADWALAAAEKFDPGRPETSFARATIERRRGHLLKAIGASSTGFRRLLKTRESHILVANLELWLIVVLFSAGALFILVEVATKGSAVVADARRWLAKKTSPVTAWLAISVMLLWPLLLPGGPLWLLLYWSALLWGYGSRSERAVTVAIWLVVAIGPWIAARRLERVALSLSPPMRAVSHFADGRLYGGFFADLDVLRAAIGDGPAGKELLADVHRTLGQWDEARQLYRQVQEVEPRNAQVLINLGAYQFRKTDFALANEYFRQASAVAPDSAAASYNLSLSYSEIYQFEESRQALAEARRIDGELVDLWVKSPHPDRVLSFDGGLARAAEIEASLVSAWAVRPEDSSSRWFAGGWKNLVAIGLTAILAIALVYLRPRRGYSEPVSWLSWRSGTVSRWLRAFFPALSQAELGEGGKAFGSILALSAVLLAPRLFSTGIELPILGGLSTSAPWLAAIVGALVYLGLCVRAELEAGN